MNLPDNPYDRNLSPKEVEKLLEDGWTRSYLRSCSDCFSSGCEKCFYTGIVGTYFKEDKYFFGSPPLDFGTVGASCTVTYLPFDRKVNFSSSGFGGVAKLIFTIPQAFAMLKMFANVAGDPETFHQEEFGIEAKFRGPPALALASLSKDRITVATVLTENQRKAVSLLRESALVEEAELFKSACEHEIFRGDEDENVKVREALGEVSPGTIMARKGTNMMIEGVALSVDSDVTALSQMK